MKSSIVSLMLLSIGCTQVDTGERGFYVRFGEVENKVLSEGLYFHTPFFTQVEVLDVQTKVTEFVAETYTRDMQSAKITYTLTFNLEPDAVVETYKTAGWNWESKLVAPVLAGAVKQVVGQFDAAELVAQREKATIAIKEFVTAKLAANNVKLLELQLSNIDYSQAFELAVETKVIATQKAEQAKNKTVEVEEEAKQKVIAAEAEARSMTIRSEALSKNKGLVEYEMVQRWNGVLPSILSTGSNTSNMLNIPSSLLK